MEEKHNPFTEAQSDDYDFVLNAVSENGSLLEFASDRLKADKTIVMAAIRITGANLQYADEKLKTDKKFVLKIIREWSYKFQYVDKKLRADKEFVIEAIEMLNANEDYGIYYGVDILNDILIHIDESLKSDRNLALVSVVKCYEAFDFFDDKIGINVLPVIPGK
jgi:hypothetical protein